MTTTSWENGYQCTCGALVFYGQAHKCGVHTTGAQFPWYWKRCPDCGMGMSHWAPHVCPAVPQDEMAEQAKDLAAALRELAEAIRGIK